MRFLLIILSLLIFSCGVEHSKTNKNGETNVIVNLSIPQKISKTAFSPQQKVNTFNAKIKVEGLDISPPIVFSKQNLKEGNNQITLSVPAGGKRILSITIYAGNTQDYPLYFGKTAFNAFAGQSINVNFDTAKSLIIEWLAIDKLNKDLNLELASVYEEEKEYKKWEYIYIDLLDAYKDNFEVLKKLWYNLAIQQRYEESIDVYLKAHNKVKADIEIVEFIADLTYQIKFYKKSLKYIKLFLKQHPRNTEKLKMKAFCYETLGQTLDAINSYKKVLELQPYNSQVQDKLEHLEWHL